MQKETKSKQLFIEEIGRVEIKKNRLSKRLTIRIKSDGTVHVSIPRWCPYREGEKVVHEKKRWILSTRDKIEKQYSAEEVPFSPEKPYQTRHHTLLMNPDGIIEPGYSIQNGVIHFQYPGLIPHTAPEIQKEAKSAVLDALRIEAKQFLPLQTEILAKRFGLTYNQIRLKNLLSRWGSCSHQNNINLNIHLMRLPEKLTDYVILHELAHTIHKNHSRKYWELLHSICPNAKLLDKELQQYSPLVF